MDFTPKAISFHLAVGEIHVSFYRPFRSVLVVR